MHAALLLLLFSANALDDRVDFQKGRELYEELEFEAALVEFRSAAAAPELTQGERARVMVWVAICAASVGDLPGARDAVEQAYDADVNVALPDYAPPKLREFFDEVRAEREAEAAAASAAEAEAAEAAAAPEDDRPATSTGNDDLPLLLFGGAGALAVGALLLTTGGVLAGFAFTDYGAATNPDAVQLAALQAQDRFNLEIGAATFCATAGGALAAAGVGLILWDVARPE